MNNCRVTGAIIVLLLFGLAACGASATPPSSHGGPVDDYVSLVNHLRATGATVVPVSTVTQPFFSVSGQVITVNGEQVQVYEYANEDSANNDAARIAPAGDMVGNTIIDWVAPPHFYRKGRIIVLYVGTKTSIMRVLQTVLGPQFAGR